MSLRNLRGATSDLRISAAVALTGDSPTVQEGRCNGEPVALGEGAAYA